MAKRRTRNRRVAPSDRREPTRSHWWQRLSPELLPVWLLILVTPWVVDPEALDSFRLPKLIVAETLALISLATLAWRLRTYDELPWRRLVRAPAFLATVPLVLVAALGFVFSNHTVYVVRTFPSLAIGVAALIGWSVALRHDERRMLALGLLVPAAVLAVLGILQFHGGWTPFAFGDISRRLAVTSRAGGAYDLAAFLLLPILVAQVAMVRAEGRWPRIVFGAVLAISVYATAVTQTLTVLVALVLASAVLWWPLMSWRKWFAVTASVVLVGAILVQVIAPLKERAVEKIADVASGDVNDLLTGRLDGWRAAVWMIERQPVFGVGHGAYRAEYGRARMDLIRDGVDFYDQQHQTFFVNAHSDPLETVAEWGLIGLAALVWALVMLARALVRRCRVLRQTDPPAAALLPAAVVAITLLALTGFPFHLALIAYPFLLVLSEVFAVEPEPEEIS